MTKEEAIRHFGSATKLAKAVGLTKSAISIWGDEIPLLRQFQLQVMTAGRLVATLPEHKQTEK